MSNGWFLLLLPLLCKEEASESQTLQAHVSPRSQIADPEKTCINGQLKNYELIELASCANCEFSYLIFVGCVQVVIDNGIMQLTLSKPGGIVTGISYNGVDNLMEIRNEEDNRGLVLMLMISLNESN